MGHFSGRSYLRLASINQVNKRLFCIHRTLSSFVKKNSKMLLAFFHLGVDIDLIDCLVEKKKISPGETNVDSSNSRSHIFTVRVRPRQV